MKSLILLCSLLILSSCQEGIRNNVNIENALKTFLAQPAESAVAPQELQFLPAVWEHGKVTRLPWEQRDLICDACEVAVQVVIDLFLLGAEEETIENALTNLCSLLGITEASVCSGAVHNYGPGIKWIIENSKPTIGGRQVCGAVVGKGCGAWEEINDWTVQLPGRPKPPVEEPQLPPEGSPSRKVLHLTDVHIDLNYQEGGEAECGTPMCCGNNTVAASEESSAGHWGDYRCDLPVRSVEHMLQHIKEEHGEEIDYIMLTGDYPPHDVWQQSREFNLASAKTFLDLVREAFPGKQVFPSIGNHEPFPCNILPGTTSGVEDSEFSPDWLLTELSEYFQEAGWLPEEQAESFRLTASYSIAFPGKPGFRIISLPSPLCLNYNFFIFMDFSDPGNILAWLALELQSAEEAGEKVHILSHVPAGNHECLGGWGREYGKIITRFENTVVAQFHGHTHNDHFQVFYDETGTRATNVGFITPSVSTYTMLNPGYRLYTVDSGHDSQSFRVLDTDTFVFDLSMANKVGKSGEPSWYKLYSGRADLEMDSMFPGDMDKLVRRLANEVDFYKKWLGYYNKGAEGLHEHKWDILCELLTTNNLDRSKCDEIIGPA